VAPNAAGRRCAFILVDGWATLDIEEVNEEKKKIEEEKEQALLAAEEQR
jgi:hypothetical protein